MVVLTGDPGPAQNSEFHQNFCWKVPLEGLSWSKSWVKNAEPVVFTTAALAETGNSSSASTGGINLPLRRNGCSAAADAASKEIADTIDHFMMNTEDLEELEPRDVEEGQTKEEGEWSGGEHCHGFTSSIHTTFFSGGQTSWYHLPYLEDMHTTRPMRLIRYSFVDPHFSRG